MGKNAFDRNSKKPPGERADGAQQRQEQARGCSMCGRQGCDRTQHSYSLCGCHGRAYCPRP